MTQRHIALGVHPHRAEAVDAAKHFLQAMVGHDIVFWARGTSYEVLAGGTPEGVDVREFVESPGVEVELVVVFGGDGTILRAAEWAVPLGYPMLGVNLGHVGFLAELEPSELSTLISSVLARDYRVEERLCLDVELRDRPGGEVIWSSFAINEVSLEKASRKLMIDVLVDVDGRPLSRWGTDGVLVATPTGSTAYAFSAKGPVLWPDLDALLVVPLLAHALFARPLVLSPASAVAVTMLPAPQTAGVVWCDGRRSTDVEPMNELTVRRSEYRLRLARMVEQPFVERLVRKFDLPVHGWRGQAERDAEARAARGDGDAD
ncbi:MAG: NAD kinase [Propioniciclava sp.]|uniref:NAD kinase n=1 Tax=Propioniciclava sp. TaxID=2038686 RepID=UPI0039E485D2